jgi:predicted O-linked N-acetylglucosamine transferase (SPINDLY family)
MNLREKLLRALEHFQSGRLSEADALAQDVLSSSPNEVDALHLRGVVAGLQDRHADAESFFRGAILLDMTNPQIYFNLAKSLTEQSQPANALEYYEKSLKLNPKNEKVWLNYGVCLFLVNDFWSALRAFDETLLINPQSAEALMNKGNCLRELKRFDESRFCHERAIELQPTSGDVWSNFGVLLNTLKHHDEALECYRKATHFNPLLAEAWSNRGAALNDLGQTEEALASYKRAFEIKPNAPYIQGELFHSQMRLCQWDDFDLGCRRIRAALLRGDRVSNPFAVLGFLDDPALQKLCAQIYSDNNLKTQAPPDLRRNEEGNNRIRLGYFSMDFREHPVAYLIDDVISHHDRSNFEVYAFSFDIGLGDSMTEKFKKSFDMFFNVANLSDEETVQLARGYQIDIAIDLGGYTQDARTQIFANRIAPIQISYLGFPGTMGTSCIDYLVGDEVVIHEGNRQHFSEKIIFMPDSFQANPNSRPYGLPNSSRMNYGLPERGFIFCCLNNTWKITPRVFEAWARILSLVPESILWLYVGNDAARKNLRAKLKALGIEPERLVFSEKVSRARYFDQYRFADLFLDTLPYNGGTTASDALWMGLPVLTVQGDSFAARMASSLLCALDLSELVTCSLSEYEEVAVALAKNPIKLSAIKMKLLANKLTHSLFDPKIFTKNLESSYQAVINRHRSGLQPADITV